MELYLPFDSVGGDRTHGAGDIAQMLATLLTDGVHPTPGDSLFVEATGGMGVRMRAGRCIIQGRIGVNQSAVSMTVGAAGALPRFDYVVLRMDLTQRWISEYIRQGTAAASPLPPTLQRDAGAWELAVARVYVPGGATQITQEQIMDMRPYESVCGYINSLIQAGTASLFAQYEAAFASWLAGNTTAFNAWFAQMQATLDENVAANLAQQIVDARALTVSLTGRPAININGGFDIAQDGDTFAAPTLYTVDQWCVATSDRPSLVARRVLANDERRVADLYALRVTCAAGANILVSPLDSNVYVPHMYKPLTVSFWARCDAGTAILSVGIGDYGSTGMKNCQLTTAWQRFEFTVPSAVFSDTVRHYKGITFYTPSTVPGFYELQGVKLENGAQATTYLAPRYDDERLRCLAHYFKQGSYAADCYLNSFFAGRNFPVPMRAIPTISGVSVAGVGTSVLTPIGWDATRGGVLYARVSEVITKYTTSAYVQYTADARVT